MTVPGASLRAAMLISGLDSERQRPALRELVHLEARHLGERAASASPPRSRTGPGTIRSPAHRPPRAAMAGAGRHCAEARMPRIRAVHSYAYRAWPRPVTCSRAPQVPQNAAPVSSRRPFGARVPSRLGAVAVTSASWVARSHNGSAIRTGRPSAPRTGRPPCMRYPSAASLHKMCLRVCPVHGPPFTGRPYSWARRSPGALFSEPRK
jgi:hypothetical protein